MSAGQEVVMGLVEQAVWGTPEADSVDYNTANNGAEIAVEAVSLVNAINFRNEPTANGVRFKVHSDSLVDTNEAMPVFSLNAAITARDEFIDLFLAAYFQNVVEGATTPFDKTFTLPVSGATQQPAFASDAGYFFTVTEKHPDASKSRKIGDCIVQTLTIKAEPGGKVSISGEWAGRGAINGTSNPSGAWTKYTSAGFHYAALDRQTVNFGAGAVDIPMKGAWEIVLTQVLEKCGQDSGAFEDFGIVKRFGTFKIPLKEGANVMSGYVNAATGTAITVNLSYGNVTPGTDDGDFDISFTGKMTEDLTREKDGIMSAALIGEISGADKSTSPITIIMANAIDRAW